MERAMPRRGARFVLAALGTVLALQACQAAPTGAAARLGTKAAAKAKVDGGIVPLVGGAMRPEATVHVRAHAAALRSPGRRNAAEDRDVRELPPTVSVAAGEAGDASAMPIAALTGGVYRSADGAVEVNIPPGALDRDAVVRFEALSTADLPAGPTYLPGVRVFADLGGASVKPGMALGVAARIDARTLQLMKALTPDFDPAALGLKADGQGGAMLAMPLRGPATADAQAPAAPLTPETWAMIEFGRPASTPAGTRSLMAETAAKRIVPAKAPTSFNEYFELELAGILSCDMMGVCLQQQMWQYQFNNSGVLDYAACGFEFTGDKPKPTPVPSLAPAPVGVVLGVPTSPAPTERKQARLPVQVVWMSDDPRVDGTPAVGAQVRFRLPTTTGFGPAEAITDAAGRASTFAPEGWEAFPTAALAPGRPVADGTPVVVRNGMQPAIIKLVKNSPIIALRLEAEGAPLPEGVTLTYEVGDRTGSIEIPIANPGADSTMASFSVVVDTDAPVHFAVTGATLSDGREPSFLPAPLEIRRNGVHPVTVRYGLVPLAPK